MDKYIEELQEKVLQHQIEKLTKNEFESILVKLDFHLAFAKDKEKKTNPSTQLSCEVDRPTALAYNFLTAPGNCYGRHDKRQADKIVLVRELLMIYLDKLPNNNGAHIWLTLFD